MTITSSGVISINSLVGEYGGSAPHAMNEYYRGGSLVANHSNNGNVPTSGLIDLQDFYGANNTSPSDYSIGITAGTYTADGGKFAPDSIYNGFNGTTDVSGTTFGSISSDNSMTTSEGTFVFTMCFTVHATGINLYGYIGIQGDQGTGTFEATIGGTNYDKIKIGGTTYMTATSTAGAYQSSPNHTRYQLTQNNVMPSSGSQTVTLST